VFAAFLPHQITEKKLKEELEKSSFTQEEFQTIINFIKKNGYSFVNGTLLPGISAVASPIFDSSSNLVAALSVVGLENTLDTSKAVQIVKEKSSLLSMQLGWNGELK
jgi:DNA-binding IclR family transcriptional regulator